MVIFMAQTKEKLRRLREKYHLGEYSKGRGGSSSPAHKQKVRRAPGRSNRGGFTARRGHRRSGFGGGSMIKQLLYGAAAGAAVQIVSPVKGLLPSGAAGFLVGKLPGAASGAAASYLMTGGSTSLYYWQE